MRRPAKRPRARAAVYGQRVDARVMREHLLGMGGRASDDGGAHPLAVAARGTTMTIISGPSGFNEHCEGLVRRMVVAEEHPVAVLDA